MPNRYCAGLLDRGSPDGRRLTEPVVVIIAMEGTVGGSILAPDKGFALRRRGYHRMADSVPV
jgi:hypothetical protein